jgi:hypothetical protein
MNTSMFMSHRNMNISITTMSTTSTSILPAILQASPTLFAISTCD